MGRKILRLGVISVNEKSKSQNHLLNAISYYPNSATMHFDFHLSKFLCVATFNGTQSNNLPACIHSHEDYEFIIPKTPVHYLMRDDNVYFGQVNRLFPVPSGYSHGIKYPQSGVKCDVISIDREFFDELKRKKNCSRLEIVEVFSSNDALRNYIKFFKRECNRPTRDENSKVEPLALLIAAEIIDLAQTEMRQKTRSNTVYQKGIRSVADYINEHYNDDLELETLAAIAGLSPSYFTRTFKKMYDCSPSVYIAMVRVSNAKVLLENTLLAVKDIALKVGYKHSSTFCDAFKKETQMAPNEYRASILGYKEGLQRK